MFSSHLEALFNHKIEDQCAVQIIIHYYKKYLHYDKKSVKIPKEESEAVSRRTNTINVKRRRTNTTMVKRRTNTTMVKRTNTTMVKRRTNTTMVKRRTNNDLQNTMHKTID